MKKIQIKLIRIIWKLITIGWLWMGTTSCDRTVFSQFECYFLDRSRLICFAGGYVFWDLL